MHVKFYKNGVKSVRPVLVIDKGRNVLKSFHAEILHNLILNNLMILKHFCNREIVNLIPTVLEVSAAAMILICLPTPVMKQATALVMMSRTSNCCCIRSYFR